MTGAQQPGLVLTLDYPGYEERPRISNLVADVPGVEVRHLMTHPLPAVPSAVEYAEALVREVTADRRVDAVVSYCLASPIAHEVARLTTGRQRCAPILIALDGAPCPATTVVDEYRRVLSGFGAPDTEPAVALSGRAMVDRPRLLLAEMASELRLHVVRAMSGVADEVDEVALCLVEELVGKAIDWLTQLMAAHNAPFLPWPGEVLLVRSRDHPFNGPWPQVPTSRMWSVDCDREDLLRHPHARRLIAEALQQRSTDLGKPL
ncbi:hypothetical protein GCM10022225_07490 [Plantactinospora mayteni]|uniref:Uncharacterized protein n=1 Tax=Plantactinospora mayteni TaxID=566021 RepID=A0ABQ4EIQ5_9ACTN|nr:hypothetical protein [Plantactinospora mayteni]GIG94504.1 hypothetical protein Pma05_10770 [Plantactinospora mayteni]